MLLFVHDDVWIDDLFLADRLLDAVEQFDVVASSVIPLSDSHVSWAFADGELNWDTEIASAAHGQRRRTVWPCVTLWAEHDAMPSCRRCVHRSSNGRRAGVHRAFRRAVQPLLRHGFLPPGYGANSGSAPGRSASPIRVQEIFAATHGAKPVRVISANGCHRRGTVAASAASRGATFATATAIARCAGVVPQHRPRC